MQGLVDGSPRPTERFYLDMSEPTLSAPEPKTPRTLTDLLELAKEFMNGRKLSKNELADFMTDLLVARTEVIPAAAEVEVVPALVDDAMVSTGFHDPCSVVCLAKAADVFIPMNVAGHYNPREAAAVAGTIYRASLKASALDVKTPEQIEATQAKLKALLPYRNP